MKPNIFDIATRELHQDAFITWLLQWGDEKAVVNFNTDELLLHECSKSLLKGFITTKFSDFNEEIRCVSAGRQWEGIDIWAKVNDRYLIIIEDKTSSTFHNNQLARYREIAETWCVKHNYASSICVYLKTGNESAASLTKVQSDGYQIYNRVNFLSLLSEYSSVSNNIFVDFSERMNKLERENSLFAEKVIGDWKSEDWQGFFQVLEKNMKIVNWNYVNNPSGGFWNAVLNWHSWGKFPVYMQLEQHRLCFKISVSAAEGVILSDNESASSVRNSFHHHLTESAAADGILHIKKPARFGSGNYMTIAVVDCENWLGNQSELLKLSRVLENLKLFTSFFEEAISQKVEVESIG
jgi:hypothetical protein